MFKFKLLNPKSTAAKVESLESYKKLLENYAEIERVTQSGGYKEAFAYFEDKINDMYRQETVDFARIKGIEEVFTFFATAKSRREQLEQQIKVWESDRE